MTSSRRIATRGIIFKDGKLLCQQLKPYKDGRKRNYWCTPGGGLDDGEALRDGLYREMVEETGIAPRIGRLLFVQQFSEDGEKEQMEFFFHIENPEDYEEIDLTTTTHGEIEIDNMEFISPSSHTVLPAFLQSVDLQKYVSTTQPVFFYDDLTTKE